MTIDDLPTDLPIDLHYDDPRAPSLHRAAVVAAARRIRRTRRAGAALALAAVVAVLAAVVPFGPAGPSGPTDPLAAARSSSFVAENPPLSDMVVIGRQPDRWFTVAWISRGLAWCIYYVEIPPEDAWGHGDGHCYQGPRDWLTKTAPAFSFKPDFMLTGMLPPQDGNYAAVGFVRGPASTVELTMFGKTTTAHVIPLPVPAAGPIGAYFISMPTAGHNEYGTQDMTRIVARDAVGHIIATIR